MRGEAEASSREWSVRRWGGLAGILGGIVFIFVPVVLFGFVPPAPTDPAAVVARFPSVEAAITLGNNINLVANVLVLGFLLALYRTLRGPSPMAALLGTGLSVLGLTILFAESQTQVAFAPLSDLYHAVGTTPSQQETLALVWQGTQAMFIQLDVAAGIILSLGFVLLGIAMVRSPDFGRGYGVLTVVLGALAVLGIYLIPVFGEASIPAVLVLPVYVVLPILLGWKLRRLSKEAPNPTHSA